MVEVRLSEATAQLDDGDRLPGAVSGRRELVEGRELRDRERPRGSGRGTEARRAGARTDPEVRSSLTAVVQAEHGLDRRGEPARDVHRARPAPDDAGGCEEEPQLDAEGRGHRRHGARELDGTGPAAYA